MYTIDDFKRVFRERPARIQGAKGYFSVLVPVIQIGDEAHLLYERRSSTIDRQPGEICFPGGEIEPGETPGQAVLRETWEEIGLPADKIAVIAELDTFHPPSDIVIYPFLAAISEKDLAGMKLNTDEVAEVFTVPVSFLEKRPYTYDYVMDMNLGTDFRYDKIGIPGSNYRWRPMQHQIISWEYEGRYIWGLTALITKWTLEILQGERP